VNEQNLLIEVIKAFESKAQDLINVLANKFDIDTDRNSNRLFSKLMTRKDNLWRGDIDENWNYWFHGDACDFKNKITGQFLHVKINRNGNFGAIDNYYLYEFLKTTESLKYIYEIINSEKRLYQLLAELLEINVLINVDEFPFKTIILNRKYVA